MLLVLRMQDLVDVVRKFWICFTGWLRGVVLDLVSFVVCLRLFVCCAGWVLFRWL